MIGVVSPTLNLCMSVKQAMLDLAIDQNLMNVHAFMNIHEYMNIQQYNSSTVQFYSATFWSYEDPAACGRDDTFETFELCTTQNILRIFNERPNTKDPIVWPSARVTGAVICLTLPVIRPTPPGGLNSPPK